MISTGIMKKGLLLVGDTTSTFKSAKDKTARPLFGDAGTATALVFNPNAEDISLILSLFLMVAVVSLSQYLLLKKQNTRMA